MRRIAIIACGEVPQALQDRYHYPRMFAAMLTPFAPDLTYETVAIHRGEPLPAIDRHDGYLFTGSRHGVYDQLAWIDPAKAFIRAAVGTGLPTVGVCFGHQLMAEALGGRVEKAKAGWGLGMQPYSFRRDGVERTIFMPAIHQDQVVEKPAGAELVSSSEHCPYAGLRYEGPALSFQFHPEFGRTFLDELIEDGAGKAFPPETAVKARATIPAHETDEAPARWLADMLRGRA